MLLLSKKSMKVKTTTEKTKQKRLSRKDLDVKVFVFVTRKEIQLIVNVAQFQYYHERFIC